MKHFSPRHYPPQPVFAYRRAMPQMQEGGLGLWKIEDRVTKFDDGHVEKEVLLRDVETLPRARMLTHAINQERHPPCPNPPKRETFAASPNFLKGPTIG